MTPCPFPPGSRIITYARDSGGDEQDRSVDQQNGVYAAWATEHQLIIARQFADRARPGSSTVGRDDFDRMIFYLRHTTSPAEVAGALLWKLNRFARNLDDSQFFKADIRRRGYQLHFIADNIPAGDHSASRVIETILEWKAQQDRVDLSTDIRRGLHALVTARKADGSYEGYAPGTPPVGFTRQTERIGTKRNGEPRTVSRWVPDPLTWESAQTAWAMRANGASLEEVHAATALFKSLGGYVTFFKNRIYLGEFKFGDQMLPNFVPALATPAQFEAVQKLRQHQTHPKRATSTYLLSGLILCGECGAPMNGGQTGSYRFYLCSRRDHQATACALPRLAAGRVESAVTSFITQRIFTPAFLTQTYGDYLAEQGHTAEQHQAKIARAKQRLSHLDRAIESLLTAIEGSAEPKSLLPRLAQREAERDQAQAELDRLQAHPPDRGLELHPETLARWATWLSQQLTTGDPAKIRPVLRACLIRLEAKKESGTAVFAVPLPTSNEYWGGESAPIRALSIPQYSFCILWPKPQIARGFAKTRP